MLYTGNSKKMHQHSLKRSKENIRTRPIMEEEKEILVNVEDTSRSLMIGTLTKEWDVLPSPGLMF